MFFSHHAERHLMEKLNELIGVVNDLSAKFDVVLAKLSAAETASTALPPTAVDGAALQPVIDGLKSIVAKIPA